MSDEKLKEFFTRDHVPFPVRDRIVSEYGSTIRVAHVFTRRGKWKYEVRLDYSGLEYLGWDLWSNAREALRNATRRGISGVNFEELSEGMFMIVIDPWGETSHPICVRREDDYGSRDSSDADNG